MTQSPSSLISLVDTPYRAFWCAEDPYSGKNFSHRRQWMVSSMRQLIDFFGINVYAYSILSIIIILFYMLVK